jgi:hypothetical protein
MHGHKGKVPNYSDALCTYTLLTTKHCGNPSLLSCNIPTANALPLDMANWLPTNVRTLTDDELRSVWDSLIVGDRFHIWWSKAEAPHQIEVWTGDKLDARQARYKSDSGASTHPFPPAEGIRTHQVHFAHSQTQRARKHNTRLKHDAPHTTVELSISDTLAMFHGMSTEDWARWCMSIPTRRSLPPSHWYAWSSVVRRFLCDCNAAQTEDEFADAAMLFLGVPQLYLDNRVRLASQKDRLERQIAHTRLPGAAPKYAAALDADDKAIRQAQAHASQGFIAKACKALGKNRVLDPDEPDVHQCLAKKHPAPPHPFNMHEPPLIVPPYLADDVASVLQKCANGSAPGWSGWTKELLGAACKADPLLFAEMGQFLAHLQACTDPRLLGIVRTGKLIALNNAKLHDDPVDPRPITISELFTKLLGLLAMRKSSWALHECQRGVCHPGGTHQAIVEVQQAYDARPNTTIATFDVANAFNATSRDAIMRKLLKIGPSAIHLLDYFRFMYGSTSDIYIRAKAEVRRYASQTGVRQGDMPASLLFSLLFTDAALAAGHFFDDILTSMWLYLDDVTTVATVDQIIALKDGLETQLADIGLSLNMRKCRVLVDRLQDIDIDRLVDAGFQVDRGCTRVLGSPVGDPVACRLFVLAKVCGWQLFWERLRHQDLHPSIALVILAKCGNVKFEHLAKSLPPEVIADAASLFDDTIEQTAHCIIGATHRKILPHVLRAVLHLRPYTVISSILYTNTVQLIAGVRTNLRIAVHEAMCHHYETLPPTPFVEPLIRAAQGITAHDTIAPAMLISPADYAHGLRLRCGVCPKHLPATCSCGHAFTSVPAPIPTIAHMLTCPHNVGVNKTTRHHDAVLSIKNVLFLHGIHSVWENGHLDPHLRPDLHIISAKKQIIIDLTVIDDVYASEEDALASAAKHKHATYDAMAERLGMIFFAVPISAYGRLHDESLKFIHHLARQVNQYRRNDFITELRTTIQQALLKGNAQTVDACAARINHKAGNWLQ